MYIIDLKYKVPLTVIDKYLESHKAYLDKYFSKSVFIVSGAKVPRTGGVIIANAESFVELMRMVKEDPFYKNNLADYSIIEFNPSKGAFNINNN